MGAKTALLAITDGDLRPALRGASRCDVDEAEHLVRQVHPGHGIAAIGDGTLLDDTNPPDDVTFATVLAGAEVLCDGRLVLDRPSQLPEHLRKLSVGRRMIMHGMHSVVGWLCFAVWEDGVMVRALSLSPDSGILEDIGEHYDFEQPYWAGEHPVEPMPGWPVHDPIRCRSTLWSSARRRCEHASVSPSRAIPIPTTSTWKRFTCTDFGSPTPQPSKAGGWFASGACVSWETPVASSYAGRTPSRRPSATDRLASHLRPPGRRGRRPYRSDASGGGQPAEGAGQ